MKVDNHTVDLKEQAHAGEISGMEWSKDGLKLASCGHDRVVLVHQLTFYSDSPRSQLIWKEKAGLVNEMTVLHRFEFWPGVDQILHGITFNGTDTELVVACEDATGYVVDLEKGNIRKELKGHAFRVTCLAYHPDGIWMALGSYDSTVTVWHGETGLMRSKLRSFGGAVLCVRFLPFGPFLCVGAVDKSTKVFHVLTGEMQFSLSAHSLAVRKMCISSEGIIATASDDKEVRLWDCRMPWHEAMGTQLAVCRGHKGPITSCQLTREGKGLLSAAEDKTMIVWDVIHGAIMRILVGHTKPVMECFMLEDEPEPGKEQIIERRSMITGDIRYIVSASEDSTVRVWDLTTGYDVCYVRLQNPLTCMAKSQDNSLIAAGDEKGGVHIFELKQAM